MALSKSLESKGQVVLCCQMCEEDKQIKWKCLTCVCLMCNKCRKIHEKFKSSEEHKIVDIKDIKANTVEKNLDFTSITCQIHPGQKCCLYCRVCQELVCPLCITKTHNTHKMFQIKDGYEVAMATVESFSSSLDKELAIAATNMTIVENLKSDNVSSCEKEEQKILSHEKFVQEMVHKHTLKLLHNLNQRKMEQEKLLNKDAAMVNQVHHDLKIRKECIDSVMNSSNVAEVFNASKENQHGKVSVFDKTKYTQNLKFFPENVNRFTIESMYGTLKDNQGHESPKIKCEIIASHRSHMSTVTSVYCCPDESFWMMCFRSGKLQNLVLKNSIITEMSKNLDMPKISALDITTKGELLVSIRKSRLYILDPVTNYITVSKYKVEPLMTNCALHISKKGKIILGALDPGNAFPAEGPRKVFVMDMNGNHETIYHLDNKKKPLFTCPARITTDINYNIYVIDTLSNDYKGRILKLHQSEGIDKVYHGKFGQNFYPCDLVCTNSNNVIVCDTNNHALHVLNTKVECIHIIDMKGELGVSWPFSLDLDSKGLFYIGCDDKENRTNAEIHAIQFSGI